MGCLERWAENEGKEVVEKFLSNIVTFKHKGTTYEIAVPNTVSEVDLCIRETFEAAHGKEPTQSEVEHIFSLLAKRAKKE